MLLQAIDVYLAQHPNVTGAALRKQAIVGEEVEILGRRCTWDRWGGDRQPDGEHLVVPAPALLYLLWRRELHTDDLVLVRYAFARQPASMIGYVPTGRRGERIDGYADLVVRAKAPEPEPKGTLERYHRWQWKKYPNGTGRIKLEALRDEYSKAFPGETISESQQRRARKLGPVKTVK